MGKNNFLDKVRFIIFQDINNDEWKWSAVALEMDLWGFGNTVDSARRDLEELMEIQYEFAVDRDEMEILDHFTEEKWFQLWDDNKDNKNGVGREIIVDKIVG